MKLRFLLMLGIFVIALFTLVLVAQAQDSPRLIHLDSVHTNPAPQDIAITPDGNYVYVAHVMFGGITVYQYNAQYQTLEQASFQPLLEESSHNRPISMAVSPDSRFLYVANQGFVERGFASSITTFMIEAESGLLNPVKNLPEQFNSEGFNKLAASPDGKYLFALSETSASLGAFTIDAESGVPLHTETLALSQRPVDMVISPDSQFLYVAHHDPLNTTSTIPLSAYRIESETGTLSEMEDGILSTAVYKGKGYSDIALSYDGSLLYAVDTENRMINTFLVNPISGELTDSQTFPVGGIDFTPANIAIRPDQSAVFSTMSGFVGESSLTPVQTYAIVDDFGALAGEKAPLSSVRTQDGILADIVVHPDGQTVLVSNPGMNALEIFAVNDGTPRTQTLFLAPYKRQCYTVSLRLCNLAQRSPESEQKYFYDAIDGFIYQWGMDYELLVDIEPEAYPAPDTPALRYSLVEIVKQEQVPAGTTFPMSLSGFMIEDLGDGLFEFYTDYRFICAEELDCDKLRELIDRNLFLSFEFEFQEELGDPLIARWFGVEE